MKVTLWKSLVLKLDLPWICKCNHYPVFTLANRKKSIILIEWWLRRLLTSIELPKVVIMCWIVIRISLKNTASVCIREVFQEGITPTICIGVTKLFATVLLICPHHSSSSERTSTRADEITINTFWNIKSSSCYWLTK